MALDIALPSGLSPATLSRPVVAFKLTPALVLRTVGSMALSVLGMYYLNRGHKERELGAMIRGAALILLSLFLFF